MKTKSDFFTAGNCNGRLILYVGTKLAREDIHPSEETFRDNPTVCPAKPRQQALNCGAAKSRFSCNEMQIPFLLLSALPCSFSTHTKSFHLTNWHKIYSKWRQKQDTPKLLVCFGVQKVAVFCSGFGTPQFFFFFSYLGASHRTNRTKLLREWQQSVIPRPEAWLVPGRGRRHLAPRDPWRAARA